MTHCGTAGLAALALCSLFPASAEPIRFTAEVSGERGTTEITLLRTRRVSENLMGVTVKLVRNDWPMVVESLFVCGEGRYSMAGIVYPEPGDGQSDAELAQEAIRMTDADLAGRLFAKDYFPIADMGTASDQAMYDLACGQD